MLVTWHLITSCAQVNRVINLIVSFRNIDSGISFLERVHQSVAELTNSDPLPCLMDVHAHSIFIVKPRHNTSRCHDYILFAAGAETNKTVNHEHHESELKDVQHPANIGL